MTRYLSKYILKSGFIYIYSVRYLMTKKLNFRELNNKNIWVHQKRLPESPFKGRKKTQTITNFENF